MRSAPCSSRKKTAPPRLCRCAGGWQHGCAAAAEDRGLRRTLKDARLPPRRTPRTAIADGIWIFMLAILKNARIFEIYPLFGVKKRTDCVFFTSIRKNARKFPDDVKSLRKLKRLFQKRNDLPGSTKFNTGFKVFLAFFLLPQKKLQRGDRTCTDCPPKKNFVCRVVSKSSRRVAENGRQ